MSDTPLTVKTWAVGYWLSHDVGKMSVIDVATAAWQACEATHAEEIKRLTGERDALREKLKVLTDEQREAFEAELREANERVYQELTPAKG